MLLLRPQEERIAFDLIVVVIDPIGDLQPIALDEEHKAIATLGVVELASSSSEGEAPTRAIAEKLYEPILRMSRLALLLYGIPASDETRIPLLLRQIGDLLFAGDECEDERQQEEDHDRSDDVSLHRTDESKSLYPCHKHKPLYIFVQACPPYPTKGKDDAD